MSRIYYEIEFGNEKSKVYTDMYYCVSSPKEVTKKYLKKFCEPIMKSFKHDYIKNIIQITEDEALEYHSFINNLTLPIDIH